MKHKSNSDNIGKRTEDYVEEQLKNLNIPYKRNRKIKQDNQLLVEYDFIIPGAIIEVKTTLLNQNIDDNEYEVKINTLKKQLQRQQQYAPYDYNIYVYCDKYVSDELKQQIQYTDKIKIISSINDIQIINLPIVAESINSLKSLASVNNNEFTYLVKKFNTIHTYTETYNKVYSLVDEQEMKRLESFNIILHDEKIPHNHIRLIEKNRINIQNYRENLFNMFSYEIKYYKINNIYPVRLVDGFSKYCEKCNKIFMSHFIEKGKCFKCLNKRLTDVLTNGNKKRKVEDALHSTNCIENVRKKTK